MAVTRICQVKATVVLLTIPKLGTAMGLRSVGSFYYGEYLWKPANKNNVTVHDK